jgi:hypothetical protein
MDKHKKLVSNCPAGYLINTGRPIDMLGKKELWRIFENQSEPHLTRLPQDLVDFQGHPCAARVPKSWGRVLYYKVI